MKFNSPCIASRSARASTIGRCTYIVLIGTTSITPKTAFRTPNGSRIAHFHCLFPQSLPMRTWMTSSWRSETQCGTTPYELFRRAPIDGCRSREDRHLRLAARCRRIELLYSPADHARSLDTLG